MKNYLWFILASILLILINGGESQENVTEKKQNIEKTTLTNHQKLVSLDQSFFFNFLFN